MAAPLDTPGIYAALGELGTGAVLDTGGLARLFGKHKDAISRAVDRGELPRPMKLFGGHAWTVGMIVRHFERLQRKAQGEHDEDKDRVLSMSASGGGESWQE